MNFEDDRDLPGPAGLCYVAAELVEAALRDVPRLDARTASSLQEADVAADKTLARSYLRMALEQLTAAAGALLPYVAEASEAPARKVRLSVVDWPQA